MAKRKLDIAIVGDLQAVNSDSFKDNLSMLPIDNLHPSEDNFYSISDIELLAEDIERQGLKHNLVVNEDAEHPGQYLIISGHRRFSAIQYLVQQGRYSSQVVPCFVAGTKTKAETVLDLIMLNATSRRMSDPEFLRQYEVLEQTLRELDAAGKGVPGRMRERIASTLKVSAAQVGKIENILHNGSEEVQQAVRSGEMSISTASAVSSLPAKSQENLIDEKPVAEIRNKDVQEYKSQLPKKPEKVIFRSEKWDGETQLSAVKDALTRYFQYEKENATNLPLMAFTDHLRKQNRSRYSSYSSFSVEGTFDKVIIKFFAPEEHENIQEIYMTWNMAAKSIQKWIGNQTTEKEKETPVISESEHEAQEDEAENDNTDTEIEGQVTFTEVCGEPEEQEAEPLSAEADKTPKANHKEMIKWADSLTQDQIDYLCNGGWYNNTMKGYLIAAAQEAGLSKQQIRDLLNGLRMALSEKDKSDAEKLYLDWN